MERFAEFFEDDNGKLSSRAAVVYIAVLTLSAALIQSLAKSDPSEGIVIGLSGALVTLVGAVVGFNKWVDGSVAKANAASSAPPATVTNAGTVNVTKEALND